MNGTENRSGNLIYFNNLRSFVVVLVVLLHIALAYSGFTRQWWIVVNDKTAIVADILCGALDIFLMPILFFVSGYFTPSSFERVTSLGFLKKKAKALALPWFTGVLLLNPFLVLMIRFSRGEPIDIITMIAGYFEAFFLLPDNVVQDRSGNPYFFSHYHLWYLSLLFYFFVGFTVIRRILKRMGKTPSQASLGNPAPALIMRVLSVVFLSAGGYALANYFFGESWFVISALQFQISRVVPYLCFFIFGIYSSGNDWISRMPARLSVTITAVALPVTLVLLGYTNNLLRNHSMEGLLIYGLLRYLLCFFMLAGILGLFRRFFNRETLFNKFMNRSSFGLYLVHLDIVVILLYLFRRFSGTLNPVLEILLILVASVTMGSVLFCLYDLIRLKLKVLFSGSVRGKPKSA